MQNQIVANNSAIYNAYYGGKEKALPEVKRELEALTKVRTVSSRILQEATKWDHNSKTKM